MFKIEKEPWGYKLIFSGYMNAEEMANWVKESEEILLEQKDKFVVMVDMRELKPLEPEAQKQMNKGQKLYKMNGMKRSAVILAGSVLTMQFKRIAKETGIYVMERYIDSLSDKNWKDTAYKWIMDKIDPDL